MSLLRDERWRNCRLRAAADFGHFAEDVLTPGGASPGPYKKGQDGDVKSPLQADFTISLV
jgi:hypothetical protein